MAQGGAEHPPLAPPFSLRFLGGVLLAVCNFELLLVEPRVRSKGSGKERAMLILILLIILLLGAVPAWPYSRGWGYYPSGALGTILLILIVLMLIGYLPF
jgi:hypothetical protein